MKCCCQRARAPDEAGLVTNDEGSDADVLESGLRIWSRLAEICWRFMLEWLQCSCLKVYRAPGRNVAGAMILLGGQSTFRI